MPNCGVLAGGEAVPEIEHPWIKARRLSKELSATLGECCEGQWCAHVMPPNNPFDVGFGAYPAGAPESNIPHDRVNRLCWELSEALTEYQGGRFQAMVLPSGIGGHTVMLTSINV